MLSFEHQNQSFSQKHHLIKYLSDVLHMTQDYATFLVILQIWCLVPKQYENIHTVHLQLTFLFQSQARVDN